MSERQIICPGKKYRFKGLYLSAQHSGCISLSSRKKQLSLRICITESTMSVITDKASLNTDKSEILEAICLIFGLRILPGKCINFKKPRDQSWTPLRGRWLYSYLKGNYICCTQ